MISKMPGDITVYWIPILIYTTAYLLKCWIKTHLSGIFYMSSWIKLGNKKQKYQNVNKVNNHREHILF